MTQLTFQGITTKPCTLTTIGEFADDGSRIYHARCACGWEGPTVTSGPDAAGTWMEHADRVPPKNCRCPGHFMEVGFHAGGCPARPR